MQLWDVRRVALATRTYLVCMHSHSKQVSVGPQGKAIATTILAMNRAVQTTYANRQYQNAPMNISDLDELFCTSLKQAAT